MYRKKTIVILLIIFVSLIIYYLINYTKQISVEEDVNFEIPKGWFLNYKEPDILLTKHKILPKIDNTEIYAYGDSINITKIVIENDKYEWVKQSFPDEDPLYKSKSWVEIGKSKLFEVLADAGGSDGEVLTYYYFQNNEVIIFSLYLKDVSSDAGMESRNDFLNVVSSYIDSKNK